VRRRQYRHHDSPGLLPGYTHLAEIGGSTFATVYRATEADTGRNVALKVVKADSVHDHLRETFDQEIRALGKVSDHPNIVTLYRAVTTADGRPVLVLELCRESIADQVERRGLLDPADVVGVGIKIAGALETAHRRGFLHRNMKPDNILVTHFGEPALADFGVAGLEVSVPANGGRFGLSNIHLAPEVLEGNRLSPATDVYGLASTLYELLSGLAPFAAFDDEAPASVILRIIRDQVRPLRLPSVPLALSDLLVEALAKAQEDRPQSALEFARSLQEVEARAGWPPTSYSVWGDHPQATPSVRSGSPDPPAVAPPPETPSPAAGPSLVPLPLAGPGERAARSSQESSPLPRLAPLPRRGPSIVTPVDLPVRHVVAPDPAGRGQPRQPLPPRAAPLPPLLPPPGPAPGPVRSPGYPAPGSVDPGPSPATVPPPGPETPFNPAAGNRSVRWGDDASYRGADLTPVSAGRRGRERFPAGRPASEAPPSPGNLPLVIAGIAAAAAVMVVAFLLVFHAI
jgi:serine/threonine protein kinase